MDFWQSIATSFDINNNVTCVLNQSWNGSAWVNVNQSIFAYDVNSNQISNLFQDWNGSSWDNYSLNNYTYDGNNNEISRLAQNWNGSSWDNAEKFTKNYDINNRIIYELYENWNGVVWENTYQNFYIHGISNDIITNALYQHWGGSSWINTSQLDKYYDVNGFLQSETIKSWNSLGTQIIFGDSSYHYSHIVSEINELTKQLKNFIISPNPTNSTLSILSTIEYKSIKIVNSIGQTVITKENHLEPISVSELSNGIYFIQLFDKKWNLLKTEKFIKE